MIFRIHVGSPICASGGKHKINTPKSYIKILKPDMTNTARLRTRNAGPLQQADFYLNLLNVRFTV